MYLSVNCGNDDMCLCLERIVQMEADELTTFLQFGTNYDKHNVPPIGTLSKKITHPYTELRKKEGRGNRRRKEGRKGKPKEKGGKTDSTRIHTGTYTIVHTHLFTP